MRWHSRTELSPLARRMGQHERHVFVCTYGQTCSEDGSKDVREELKERVKAAGLKRTVRAIAPAVRTSVATGRWSSSIPRTSGTRRPTGAVLTASPGSTSIAGESSETICTSRHWETTSVRELSSVAASKLDARSVGPIRVRGSAVLYRLHDVGYEIQLDRAAELLASSAPERARPTRGEAQAIQIHNPPLSVSLGPERLVVSGRPLDAEVSARIFHFGVVSLRVRVMAPTEMTWEEFTAFGNAVQAAESEALFSAHLQALAARIQPATERPFLASTTEDYIVFRVNGLRVAGGETSAAEALRHVDVAPLLLNESRPLSRDARDGMLPNRFSYYADDLAILTWENALVVDPSTAEETDVEYVLVFANAQLLELR